MENHAVGEHMQTAMVVTWKLVAERTGQAVISPWTHPSFNLGQIAVHGKWVLTKEVINNYSRIKFKFISIRWKMLWSWVAPDSTHTKGIPWIENNNAFRVNRGNKLEKLFFGKWSFHHSRITFMYLGTLDSSFLNLIWGMGIVWTSKFFCKGDLAEWNPRQILFQFPLAFTEAINLSYLLSGCPLPTICCLIIVSNC